MHRREERATGRLRRPRCLSPCSGQHRRSAQRAAPGRRGLWPRPSGLTGGRAWSRTRRGPGRAEGGQAAGVGALQRERGSRSPAVPRVARRQPRRRCFSFQPRSCPPPAPTLHARWAHLALLAHLARLGTPGRKATSGSTQLRSAAPLATPRSRHHPRAARRPPGTPRTPCRRASRQRRGRRPTGPPPSPSSACARPPARGAVGGGRCPEVRRGAEAGEAVRPSAHHAPPRPRPPPAARITRDHPHPLPSTARPAGTRLLVIPGLRDRGVGLVRAHRAHALVPARR